MDAQQTRNILEACLLVAGKAMTIAQLENLFESDIDRPDRNEIKAALIELQSEYQGRGIELVEVASGWRLQSSASMEHWVARLFQEKTPRYSRALLETLVLIAYRQPITRGEIEEVRGVAVSSNIIKTLQEREWVKEVGYKDVPGKPALWGTTRQFLDYFNLKRLDELPTLAEARELEEIDAALAAEMGLVDGVTDSVAANDSSSAEAADDESAAEVPLENSLNTGEVDAEVDVDVEPDSGAQLVTLADSLPGADAAPVSNEFSALVSSFIQSEQSVNQPETDSLDSSQDSTEPTSDLLEVDEVNNDPPAREPREISAHDVVSEEWRAPVPSPKSEPPAASDSSNDSIQLSNESDSNNNEDGANVTSSAESELRRVIDEFADEHQKEIDARDHFESRTLGSNKSAENSHSISKKDSITADDHNGLRHIRKYSLYGVSGAIDSEIEVIDDEGKNDEGRDSEP